MTQPRIPALSPTLTQKSICILRLPAVIARTGLSRSTIYNLLKSGDFPRQIHLSPRTMGFVSSEIDHWINAKIAQTFTGLESIGGC